MMRKANTSHDDAIRQLYLAGWGFHRIGKELDIHRATVRHAARRLGLPIRSSDGGVPLLDPVRNAAIVTARAQGASLAEVAQEFGISRQRVHQITQTVRVSLESSPAASQKQANQ